MNKKQRERRRQNRIAIESQFISIIAEYDRDYLTTNYRIENLEILQCNKLYPALL
jgi:hypothetical protein